MAVVSIEEIHNGREGGDEAGDEKSKAELTRCWRVRTDSNYDGADTVLNAFPGVGAQHLSNPYLFIRRRRAVNESNSKRLWIVTLNFSNDTGQQKSENPLMDPAKISWSTETSQEPAFVDKDENAILNSAGDYYEDGVNVEVSFWVAKIRKNLGYVPSWINSYRNAINSDPVTIDGVPVNARSAKVKSIGIGEWEQRNKIWYRVFDLSIKIQDTWVKYILDQGLRRKDPSDSTKRIRCIGEDGKDATRPVLLDGSGGQLANPSPSTAVANEHHIFPELPFAFLPLN